MGISIHATKYSWHQYVVYRHMYYCDWYIFISVGLKSWYMAYIILDHKNVLCVAITARATPHHFLIWMKTLENWVTLVIAMFFMLNTNETKNPRHLDCGKGVGWGGVGVGGRGGGRGGGGGGGGVGVGVGVGGGWGWGWGGGGGGGQ